jgi:hypothetical protein
MLHNVWAMNRYGKFSDNLAKKQQHLTNAS